MLVFGSDVDMAFSWIKSPGQQWTEVFVFPWGPVSDAEASERLSLCGSLCFDGTAVLELARQT